LNYPTTQTTLDSGKAEAGQTAAMFRRKTEQPN
jgi:hypothetical protein